MYTAEMARKDYEENNLIISKTNFFVEFAERKIEQFAKNGKNHYGFSYPNLDYFEKCIPYIYEQLEKRGFNVCIRLDHEHGPWISIKW